MEKGYWGAGYYEPFDWRGGREEHDERAEGLKESLNVHAGTQPSASAGAAQTAPGARVRTRPSGLSNAT